MRRLQPAVQRLTVGRHPLRKLEAPDRSEAVLLEYRARGGWQPEAARAAGSCRGRAASPRRVVSSKQVAARPPEALASTTPVLAGQVRAVERLELAASGRVAMPGPTQDARQARRALRAMPVLRAVLRALVAEEEGRAVAEPVVLP